MCLQNIYQIYILKLLWFTTLTPQKEFHDSMTILYQYNPDVSFHKDSLFTYPWNFSFGQQTTLTSNRNVPCVYIDRCVCAHIYIYIYTNIYALTQCNKHRRTQTLTISRQISSLCFSLVSTVPRIFSSKYISFHVINMISRQQATSACKAKKD